MLLNIENHKLATTKKKLTLNNFNIKMIRNIKIIFLFCFIPIIVFAQANFPNNCDTVLADALKKPEEVVCLDLRSQGLRIFPNEILNFENLESLNFSADYESHVMYKLTPERREEIIKAKKEYGILYLSNRYNPNYIKKIPQEISHLKKLKYLNVWDTKLSKGKIKKLAKLMPNCKILSKYGIEVVKS